MLNDSIASSPTAGNRKSIYSQRTHRQLKRRKKAQTQQELDQQLMNESDGANDDEEIFNIELNKTFNVADDNNAWTQDELRQFQHVQLYSEADRQDCMQAQKLAKERKKLTPTKGFIKLTQLTPKRMLEENQTDFDFTNTELIDFCKYAEQEFVIAKPAESYVDESKSVVENILADFCSSPSYLAEEQLFNEEDYCVPVFRFRGMPIRTYSKAKKCKIKLEPLDISAEDVVDDLVDTISDSSSVLSVQEDPITEVSMPNLQSGSFDANASQRLCENLLNLSAFFAAKQDESVTAKSVEIKTELCDTLQLPLAYKTEPLMENFIFAEECQTNVSNANLNDFHWFDEVTSCCTCAQRRINGLNNELVDTLETSIKEISENETKNVCNRSGAETWLEDCDFFANFKTQDVLENKATTNVPIDISTTAKILVNENSKDKVSTEREEQDDWYDDCDFFADINTEALMPKNDAEFHEKLETKVELPFMGFRTAGQKRIEISKEAQQRALQILENLPEIPVNKKSKEVGEDDKQISDDNNVDETVVNTKINVNETANNEMPFMGFRTAGQKSIKISALAQEKAAKILENLPEISFAEKTKKLTENEKTYNEINDDCAVAVHCTLETKNIETQFLGFRTAGQKRIEISAEAQKRAAQILENLPEISVNKKTTEFEKSDNEKNDKYDDVLNLNANMNDIETKSVETPFMGFRTAGQKRIEISKEAQKRAAQILENLPELLPENAENKTEALKIEPPQFMGFRTAGQKRIEISAEAQKRAARILENLPELPHENSTDKMVQNCQKSNNENEHENFDIENMQFSEWQPLDYNKDIPENIGSAQKRASSILQELPKLHETHPNVTHTTTRSKRKLELQTNDNTSADNCETPVKSSNRNPLQYTLSELATHTPLSKAAKTSIITRKNLLSLSKKRKLNANNCEPNNNSTNMDTPIRKSYTNVKTPNNTPALCVPVTEFNPENAATSTPRTFKNSNPLECVEFDADFEHIKWEQNEQESMKPSPKERIERLSIYGDPPPISPICMPSITTCSSNFRAPGLRRNRSNITLDKTK